MSKRNLRTIAFETLTKVDKGHAYSNLLLNQTIQNSGLQQKDVALLTEIVYGTIQRKKTLDYYLKPFLPQKIKPKDEWIISLLRMSLYQMIYLERIPDRAVIFEAVQIAKEKGHKGLASLTNGILRNIQRKGIRSVESIRDQTKRIATKFSHPEWLVSRWLHRYGMEETQSICEVNLKPPTVTARVNLSRTSVEDVSKHLQAEQVVAKPGNLAPVAIEIIKGNLPKSRVYRDGLVTIQDESSMLVKRALGVRENERVLDCCAGPGGKATHIAEHLHHDGEVVALDRHEHKVKLIESQSKRLQLSNVTTRVLDARTAATHYPSESFDRILVDAPCSGFGVIRRKPDIKWRKREKDIAQLATVQFDILCAVAPLLKKGGTLVYSTCTIEWEENEHIVQRFLDSHPNYRFDLTLVERLPQKLLPYMTEQKGHVQILPHYFGSDGFFMAALEKKA